VDLAHLVSATLGISPPWQVSTVSLAEGGRRLDVTIQCINDRGRPCPCGSAMGEECEAVNETWFHENFLRYATYLHTRIPQPTCFGGRRLIDRPWIRPGSKFVKIG